LPTAARTPADRRKRGGMRRVSLCACGDRCCYMASMTHQLSDLPLWRRVIIIVMIPFVLPAMLLLVLLLLLAMAWNEFGYGVYWVRWKLFGVPIPPMCPPPTERPPT
jgi:hypothetical protein